MGIAKSPARKRVEFPTARGERSRLVQDGRGSFSRDQNEIHAGARCPVFYNSSIANVRVLFAGVGDKLGAHILSEAPDDFVFPAPGGPVRVGGLELDAFLRTASTGAS